MYRRFIRSRFALALLALTFAGSAAKAEVTEVHFAQQTSFTYLQLNVMLHQHLLEKQGAALGMPNLKMTLKQFAGSDLMNDALISGAADVVSGGMPALLTAWDKTKGTSREVRGVSATGHFALIMNSRNPDVHSIADLKSTDKIAITGVKVSGQALILQMAAAKMWGPENYAKLDSLTFTMSPADQATMMLSGAPGVENAFGSPPFSLLELKDPKIHTILSSIDIIGDATSAVLWSSKPFHDANPTVYKAIIGALKEAQLFINTNPHEAIGYYVADTQASTSTADQLSDMLADPHYGYDIVPRGVMTYANFLHDVKVIKNLPSNWKELFFPEIYDFDGS